MLTKSRSLRRDYPAMFGLAMIMLGIFMIGGIAYTYSNRPPLPLDPSAQALEGMTVEERVEQVYALTGFRRTSKTRAL